MTASVSNNWFHVFRIGRPAPIITSSFFGRLGPSEKPAALGGREQIFHRAEPHEKAEGSVLGNWLVSPGRPRWRRCCSLRK
jgi:hypothetical protein